MKQTITQEEQAIHTAGPWRSESMGWLARVWGPGGRTEENEICVLYAAYKQTANARLIAAAPDLLAALKDLAATHEGYRAGLGPCICAAHEAARAAIAKAEGP